MNFLSWILKGRQTSSTSCWRGVCLQDILSRRPGQHDPRDGTHGAVNLIRAAIVRARHTNRPLILLGFPAFVRKMWFVYSVLLYPLETGGFLLVGLFCGLFGQITGHQTGNRKSPKPLIYNDFRPSWSIGDSNWPRGIPRCPILCYLVTLCCHIIQIRHTPSQGIPPG